MSVRTVEKALAWETLMSICSHVEPDCSITVRMIIDESRQQCIVTTTAYDGQNLHTVSKYVADTFEGAMRLHRERDDL